MSTADAKGNAADSTPLDVARTEESEEDLNEWLVNLKIQNYTFRQMEADLRELRECIARRVQ